MKWILLITVVIAISISTWMSLDNSYYEYSLVDSHNNERILFRFPRSSIAKYSGWKYDRNGPFSVELWYPSLQDKVTYNKWNSSKQDKISANTKPDVSDKKLSISINNNHIIDINKTLDITYKNPWYALQEGNYKYELDRTIDSFKRYTFSSPGRATDNILYLPTAPIEGLFCLKCIEKANCRIIGVSQEGVYYHAFFEEESMPDEAINIQKAINTYLNLKVVKTSTL